ncbi:hypothetical protein [Chryseobacterium indologenes]|nr:hypothetical protein [Chryseobacterium indologenes]
MKNYKETYRGWVIESYGTQFKYYPQNKKKEIVIGDSLPMIRRQIDHFNA